MCGRRGACAARVVRLHAEVVQVVRRDLGLVRVRVRVRVWVWVRVS